MASRPSFDRFRVAPEGQQNYVSAPQVQNNTGRQLQQVGGALVDAGGVAAQVFEDKLQEANKLRLEEATVKAMDIADRLKLDPAEGFAHVKGKDAIDRESGLPLSDEWGEKFDKELENITEGLGNDAQRQAFNSVRLKMGAQFRGQIEQHSAEQYGVYEMSVVKGKQDTLTRRLSLTAGDTERSDAIISEIKSNSTRMANLTGANSPEAIDMLVREDVTAGITMTMSSLLDNGDLETAQQMFDRYKDDLTDTGFHQLSQALRGEQRVVEADAIASSAFDEYRGQNASAAPVALGNPVANMPSVSGRFGENRGTHSHGGNDLPVPVGTAASATAAGKVTFVGERGSYGYMVEVDHGGGTVTRYAHLSGFDPKIKAGDTVRAGQRLGATGGQRGARGAGRSTGPHLHYEVRVNGKAVDPNGDHKVSGGGARGSTVAAIERIAQSTSDPKVRQMAEQRFRSLAQADEADRRDQQDELKGTAQLAIVQGRAVPKSVLMGLDDGNKADVLSYQESVRKQRMAGAPKVGDVLWGKLKQEIVAGNIRDPKQLIEFIPFLDKSDYNDLASTLKANSPELDSAKTTFSAMEKLNVVLKQYGLDSKDDPEEYGAYRSKFLDYVRRSESSRGKPLTLDEAYSIGVALATENPDGRKGYELANPMIRYNFIPPAARERLQRQGGGRLTQQQIERLYAVEIGVIQ